MGHMRGGRENGGGRKKELVQFLLRIYNGPHVANFTAKFRLQCMKCLLFPLCWPLRITYEENHPTYYTNFCPLPVALLRSGITYGPGYQSLKIGLS